VHRASQLTRELHRCVVQVEVTLRRIVSELNPRQTVSLLPWLSLSRPVDTRVAAADAVDDEDLAMKRRKLLAVCRSFFHRFFPLVSPYVYVHQYLTFHFGEGCGEVGLLPCSF
jgi:hypothetical protein